jgi:hypothetical protein
VEIQEIFVNSDNDSEYDSEESDYDSDSEELLSKLVPFKNAESEDPLPTDEVPGPSDDGGGDGGRPTVGELQQVCSSWNAASHFTHSEPAVHFDESQLRAQSHLPSPSEA